MLSQLSSSSYLAACFWAYGHFRITHTHTHCLHSLYCSDLKEVLRSDPSSLKKKKPNKKTLLSLWKALVVFGLPPPPPLRFSSSLNWSNLIEVNQILKMLRRACAIACSLLERTRLDEMKRIVKTERRLLGLKYH